MAHAVGHLSLLHCGSVRDGGRFACADTRHQNQETVYHVHMLLGDDSDLPRPLFTPEEEADASSFAATLLTQCGYQDGVPGPLNPTPGLRNLQCLG